MERFARLLRIRYPTKPLRDTDGGYYHREATQLRKTRRRVNLCQHFARDTFSSLTAVVR